MPSIFLVFATSKHLHGRKVGYRNKKNREDREKKDREIDRQPFDKSLLPPPPAMVVKVATSQGWQHLGKGAGTCQTLSLFIL